jgi:hypothetical protein
MISLSAQNIKYKGNVLITEQTKTVIADENGLIEIDLIENVNMIDNKGNPVYYILKTVGQELNINFSVPILSSVCLFDIYNGNTTAINNYNNEDSFNIIKIYFFPNDSDGDLDKSNYTVKLSKPYGIYKNNIMIKHSGSSFTSDITGIVEMDLIDNINMDCYYNIFRKKIIFASIMIPDSAPSYSLWDVEI